jgi:AsmA protein
VEFSLNANQANVQELETIFNVQSAPTPANAEPSFLTRVSGSGQLSVDTVIYDQVTLKNLKSTLALDHGMITMKPITASVFNGQQTGAVVVNMRARPATYTVDSKLENVDANQLLSSISSIKETLYGLLSANADIGFTTTAGSTNIARSLNGQASVNLKDGKIAHMDLLHSLATIGKFQRTAEAIKPFTDLVQLTGDFDIKNGVARTQNLKAVIPGGSLAADGSVDLAQQALNLRLTAVLSKDYSQSVGGTNVAGWLNTVLANSNGELVIPVLVSGNFNAPQFAPDVQKVAQMKLENLVPSLQNPADLKSRILGDILGQNPEAPPPQAQGTQEPQKQEQQQQQPPQQQKPSNPLLDALEKILKGKSEKQPEKQPANP